MPTITILLVMFPVYDDMPPVVDACGGSQTLHKLITTNTFFYDDDLPILREHIAGERVNLIYLDPPFNSNRSYNVLFKDEGGTEPKLPIVCGTFKRSRTR